MEEWNTIQDIDRQTGSNIFRFPIKSLSSAFQNVQTSIFRDTVAGQRSYGRGKLGGEAEVNQR
jgi:hypothetical protein